MVQADLWYYIHLIIVTGFVGIIMGEIGRSYGRNRKHERLQEEIGTEAGKDLAGMEA